MRRFIKKLSSRLFSKRDSDFPISKIMQTDKGLVVTDKLTEKEANALSEFLNRDI